MRTRPGFPQLKAVHLALAALLAIGYLTLSPRPGSGVARALPPQAPEGIERPSGLPGLSGPSAPSPETEATPVDWLNNEGRFTEPTRQLVRWLDEGRPLEITIGDEPASNYGFRPAAITTGDFRISAGVDSQMPAEFRVYSGRRLNVDGTLGDRASLAVVNGAVSMAISRDGEDYLVETNPETGLLEATRISDFYSSHSCQDATHQEGHLFCALSEGGRLASAAAPDRAGTGEPAVLPVDFDYPPISSAGLENADEPVLEAAQVDHSHFRLGPQYDASLKDMIVLHVSSKSQTGDSSLLSSRAASYFSYVARTADIYERQLGLRYLLQELILVPSDSSDADPGNPPDGTYSIHPDLEHFRAWLGDHRPQSAYQYGHAALWTLVGGASGGVVGTAWTDAYGSSSYGHSVQERNWGWEVHTHELGHNIGSSHTSGGIMNGSLTRGAEDFFKLVSNQTYTGAMDIYNYMGASSRAFVSGPASLRHPEEIPFGVDDSVSTASGTPVSFDPLANDLNQVTSGAANSLSLVEVGAVYPASAGTAEVVNGEIRFSPAAGYTGQVWFSYTLAGNVGNSGQGWLHAADVVVTVGGDSTEPTLNPALKLADDFILSDLSGSIRFNPLLNDEGAGRLWSGNVEAVVGPNDSTPESYSDGAFHLVGATIVSGNGSLNLEAQGMSRGGKASYGLTGYIVYQPGAGEVDPVVIEYTAKDANGNTAIGHVSIGQSASQTPPAPYITVVASESSVAEDSGRVIAFTVSRAGEVDLSTEEVVHFTVSGTADPASMRADLAFAGQDAFDPVTGGGSITIPAGESLAHVYAAVLDDGVSEDYETCILALTGSSSGLDISSLYDDATLYIRDNSVIYVEPFDSFNGDEATWNGWLNLKNMRSNGKVGEDWFDWTLLSGSTPTSTTGPAADHTSGSGKYLYAEATGNIGNFTLLQSPAIDVSGRSGAELEFAYHMYGASMGTLTLDLYVNGALVAPGFWSASGQQSTSSGDWKTVVMDVSAFLPASTLQLRFRADIGNGETSDIAIDDVRLTSITSGDPLPPHVLVDPIGCSVEIGQSVYLSVIPEGFPSPQIQWMRDGADIAGATGPSFFISAMDANNAGSYSARISNSEGEAYSLPAELTVPDEPPPDGEPGGQYYSWAGDSGLMGGPGDPDLSGPTLDPDLDGIVNLFEFAFGMDPMAADNTKMPRVAMRQVSGQVYMEITYNRRTGGTGTTGIDYAVDNITYQVETGTDLNAPAWDKGAGVVQAIGTPIDNGNGTEQVTVRRVQPVSSGPAFMRVSIVQGF